MRVIIIGASGQLGSNVCQELSLVELVPITHSEIEVTDMDSVKQIFDRYQPEVVINTAAYVRVDDCEDNPDKAFLVEVEGRLKKTGRVL